MTKPKSNARSKAKPEAKSLHEPPSRAGFAKAVLTDLMRPLAPADAVELFAVRVVDIARKFDPFWFHVIIDLTTKVVDQCEEQAVAATIRDIANDLDGLRAHIVRRRINRNLPIGPGESRLTETERYEMARAIVVAACDTLKDEELWEAIWGRKTEWSPVITAGQSGAAPDGEGRKSGRVGYKADQQTDTAN